MAITQEERSRIMVLARELEECNRREYAVDSAD
jgi:hypothetical protein